MYPRPIVREPETEYQYDEQQRASKPAMRWAYLLIGVRYAAVLLSVGAVAWAFFQFPW